MAAPANAPRSPWNRRTSRIAASAFVASAGDAHPTNTAIATASPKTVTRTGPRCREVIGGGGMDASIGQSPLTSWPWWSTSTSTSTAGVDPASGLVAAPIAEPTNSIETV
jgi:hypothetical protein